MLPLVLKTLRLNIITTNKNRTAIAPAQIITKAKAKNSNPNKDKMTEALQKIKIKNKMKQIGLLKVETSKKLITTMKLTQKQ